MQNSVASLDRIYEDNESPLGFFVGELLRNYHFGVVHSKTFCFFNFFYSSSQLLAGIYHQKLETWLLWQGDKFNRKFWKEKIWIHSTEKEMSIAKILYENQIIMYSLCPEKNAILA